VVDDVDDDENEAGSNEDGHGRHQAEASHHATRHDVQLKQTIKDKQIQF
jgi:hypothetical protein